MRAALELGDGLAAEQAHRKVDVAREDRERLVDALLAARREAEEVRALRSRPRSRRARGLDGVEAAGTPPSRMTSTSGPTASRTSGRTSRGATESSSWRPPWLDTQIALKPVSSARTASDARATPLRATGLVARRPEPRRPSVELGLHLRRDELDERPAAKSASGTAL